MPRTELPLITDVIHTYPSGKRETISDSCAALKIQSLVGFNAAREVLSDLRAGHGYEIQDHTFIPLGRLA